MKIILLFVFLILTGCANMHSQHLFEKDREKILLKNEQQSKQTKFSTIYFISNANLLDKTSYLPIMPSGFALDQHIVAMLPVGSFSQQVVKPGIYDLSHVGLHLNSDNEKISWVHISNTKQFEFKPGREYFIGFELSPTNMWSGYVVKEYNGFEGERLVKTLPLAKVLSKTINLADVKHSSRSSLEKLSKLKMSNGEILIDSAFVDSSEILVNHTQPNLDGIFSIEITANRTLTSLLINDKEEGKRNVGKHSFTRFAPAGLSSEFVITATDQMGNTDIKKIIVIRNLHVTKIPFGSLNPLKIDLRQERDAVAIIIGIQNYKRVPKADFANNDAKVFNEYAIRALGIKPENIKLLLDEDADEVNIVKAFENWLPLKVTKNKTDVYVFYSGHGLPSNDGKSLYFLPYGVDKELLSRTAVGQAEVVSALVASKPKSVTMFIDACYSGQTRVGETLLASAKPIVLKTDTNAFPPNFTVISASANDQISSSSPELKHGIFSFYLMKGMEGDADGNKDGKITAGEMQEYLSDKVSRQAMSMSRKQDTQLVGDANRVLMGR